MEFTTLKNIVKKKIMTEHAVENVFLRFIRQTTLRLKHDVKRHVLMLRLVLL